MVKCVVNMNLEGFKRKYRPKDIFELMAIDNKDKHRIIDFINAFQSGNPPKNRGLLLVGKSGIGKTETPYTIARQFGMSVLEVNASDTRSREGLRDVLTYSLDCEQVDEPVIILLDEIDGLVKREDDSGGVRYIAEVLKTTRVPIILTANDDAKLRRSFKTIVNKVEKIEYKPINTVLLRKFIKRISVEEGLHLRDVDIMKIAQMSLGDMRKVFSLLFLPDAIRIERAMSDDNTIFTFLNALYGSSTPEQCLEVYYNSDIRSVSNVYLWIHESLPSYNSSSIFLEKAYKILARYGVIVKKSDTLNNFYLRNYVIKAMIFELKALIGSGFDRFRKYPTPVEFQLGKKLKAIREIKKQLKFCFYDENMSLSAFGSNFWAVRQIYQVDRKFVVEIMVRIYRYALLVEDDIKEQKELFCKMASMVHFGDVRYADEFINEFEILDDDDSHRFAVAVTKRHPNKVKTRKWEVKQKIREQTKKDAGTETDLDSLADIDVSDLL